MNLQCVDIGEIKANIETIRSKIDRKEDSDILNWLTPVNYGPQQSENLRLRQEGTGQWLLDSVEYQNWLNTNKQTLFCPGIPGAGKTTLTAIVVSELHKRFHSDTNVGLAYIYCDFARCTEQNAEHFVSSLLKQLIQEQSCVPDNVKSLYSNRSNGRTRPSFGEISEALHIVAAMFPRLFIIVDALDECQVFDGCRTKLMAEIFSLQAKCGANIFATSRFFPEIVAKFDGCISIEIRASSHDVWKYLDGNLSRLLPDFVISSLELQEEIKTKIVKAVDGMYV